MRKPLLIILPISLIIMAAIFYKGKPMPKTMTLSSSSFAPNQPIPQKHTCEGEGLPVQLSWKNVPAKTVSLALIMEDPDASSGNFVHWVAWNIDPRAPALDTISEGTNSGRKIGYMGPCPPSGQHRYFFRLYALDSTLNLSETTTKEELLNAMKGHILGEAELMGTYEKGLVQN